MTSKANVKRDRKWRGLALGMLALVLWQAGPASAADEPDLIFRRSTVFKWLSPNDKLATYALDDPEVEGRVIGRRAGTSAVARRNRVASRSACG